MKQMLDFYLRLAQNNNKQWFDAHRAEYEAAKRRLHAFAEEFIHGIEAFDSRCKGLTVKDCTYRINRDIRFSHDKSPYKHWTGIYVCPKGKKSGMAGYYVHFEPINNLYFVCGGLYNPSKEVLASVREQIMLEPDDFHARLLSCGDDFRLNWEGALKRMPKGFSEADTHSEYYRLKTYEVYKSFTAHDVMAADFLATAVDALKRCLPFNEMLNQCYDYAFDTDK